jgi:hypothetical protein
MTKRERHVRVIPQNLSHLYSSTLGNNRWLQPEVRAIVAEIWNSSSPFHQQQEYE